MTRVPGTRSQRREKPPQLPPADRVRAEHYRRLGEINEALGRKVAELRLQASELRRAEHLRYREEIGRLRDRREAA